MPGNIMSRWAEDVDPNNPLPEYPRPGMVREDWQNLNGVWNYALSGLNEKPDIYSENILVPFPIESSLSGVKKNINDSTLLWYNRNFEIPQSWSSKSILLHFEAVDWHTKVWINNIFVGEHKGGYDPFTFDITDMLSDNSGQSITISVWDPTDKGTQPCGKQVQKPGGIFYTSTTGIWQTVWLEPVEQIYIKNYSVITNIDNNRATFKISPSEKNNNLNADISISDSSKIVGTYSGSLTEQISISITDPKYWSADNPHLYDLEIKLKDGDKLLDKINGYFGMRKISIEKDSLSRYKIMLNNEFVFQNGTLDQGFWPDGIYTAPTDDALKFDIEITKALGFNMLRKHVKVESRRFYYWCDKLGILVWQDMPSGDKKISPDEVDIIRSTESAEQYEFELKKMIQTHFNNPSIIMWVPFNEGWGQYDTERIVNLIKENDPTRLVNNTSGWADRGVGDIYDIHHYPEPRLPEAQNDRAIVLGEFGGIGLRIDKHTWTNENWGYVSYTDNEDFIRRYEEFYTDIWDFVDTSALSAVVYTQITDVETEVNGLLTYDREIIKYDKNVFEQININDFLRAPSIKPRGGYFNIGDKVTITHDQPDLIHYTLDGDEPEIWDSKYHSEIVLISDCVIKAKAISSDRKSRTITAKFTRTDVPRPEYKYEYSEKYRAGGDFALIDKERGTLNFSDGRWQGFEEVDLDIIINITNYDNIKGVEINFLEDLDRWIFLPERIELSASNDGENFESIQKIELEKPQQTREANIRTISFELTQKDFSFIRVHAKNIGRCPDWHSGKNGKTWLFVDEIEFIKN